MVTVHHNSLLCWHYHSQWQPAGPDSVSHLLSGLVGHIGSCWCMNGIIASYPFPWAKQRLPQANAPREWA